MRKTQKANEKVTFEVVPERTDDTYPLVIHPNDEFTLTFELQIKGAHLFGPDAIDVYREFAHQRLDRQIDRIRLVDYA